MKNVIVDEINDMLEEHNIKINYTWSKNSGDDCKINLKLIFLI